MAKAIQGFNGAAFFQSGKYEVRGWKPLESGASMEPLFFKAENRAQVEVLTRENMASMEPLFFKAENRRFDGSFLRQLVSFNGAAFFQSGKYASASFLKTFSDRLQWSRFFSKRKMTNRSVPVACPLSASMEPLFFKAENSGTS